MKRMHALPIELPLVASGEYLRGTIILDNSLKVNKNYLIIMEIYGDDTLISMVSAILNTIKSNTNDCHSSLFPGNEFPMYCFSFTTRFGNENKLTLKSIGDYIEGNIEYSYIAYVYELPFSTPLP